MARKYTPIDEIKVPTDVGIAMFDGESRASAERRRELAGLPPKPPRWPWQRWRERRRAGR